MAKKKTKALAVRKTTEITSTELPEHLRGKVGSGKGLDSIDKKDLVLPRLILLQKMSPEVEEKGMDEGTIINSLTGENYGSEFYFVPINHSKMRICWKDRNLGGGMMCASDDNKNPRSLEDANNTITELADIKRIDVKKGAKLPKITSCNNCPLKDWNNDAKLDKQKQPPCTQIHVFPIIIEGSNIPIALSMDRTKVKVAKKLISMAVYAGGGLDIFAKRYKLGVTKQTQDKYTFYNYTIEPAGFASKQDYLEAEKLYESFQKLKSVTVHHDKDDAINED